MSRRLELASVLLTLLISTFASAGPPFLTDDPQPVDFHHYEAYIFSTLDRAPEDISAQGPAFEFNYGFAPNFQFHVVIPMSYSSPPNGPGEYGLGDMEIGVKFRFVQETANRPQIGIFPMVEAPTGNAARGLGNGITWYRLPLWIQKSRGPWTSYGGGGVTINHAAGMKNNFFAGWLLQRDLSEKLTLGGEFFTQGADTTSGRGNTTANLGGYYNFSPNFSLLFSAGHTVAGETHAVGYLGLYWTWGPHTK